MSRTNPRVVGQPGQSILADDPASRTRRVRVLARLLDNSISIPGTGWKIGFDPIVGLIPGIGDLIGAVLSGYIILEAARAEVPGYTLARMLVNVGIDTVLGSIPAVGDVFDAVWKSNTKNVALLESHLSGDRAAIRREKRTAIGLTVLAVVALVLIIGAGLALGIYVARLLWGLVTR
ncbi:MAG TPA: DUF4112 domain-containing protein [Gemmatimonadaceae bacterium]|nr:DUF4112 domain-containing protein [Gemmatimonadaceae bacterium]